MAFSNANLLPESASTFEGGTHSWELPSSNTTLSVSSTEWLSGTRSLRFTATAAGSVWAYSPYVTGAVAGETYVARVPVRVSTTSAKTFTVRMAFFADTGGSLSYVDFVRSSGTDTGWRSEHYVTASAVAPTGTTRVRIYLIADGLAAGEFVNIDDVIITTVARRAGDLLEYNTGSVENDTSGWSVTNGTLSRVSGFLYSGAGYYVLGATSAAAGQMRVRTASYYTVTEGTAYVAYAAVQGTATALAGVFAIEWYDSASSWLSTSFVNETFDSSIRRFAISGTAPAGAVKAKLMVRPEATAAGQVVYLDDATLCPAPNYPGNLLTYEEYSTESTLPAWTLTGSATQARAYLTASNTEGFYALRLTPSEASNIQINLDRLVPVTPGQVYEVGAVFWRHNPNTANTITSSFRTRIDWYDASGNLFQVDNPDQFYSYDSSAEWFSHTNSETREAPEGAAYGRVGIEVSHTANGADNYYLDVIKFFESQAEYTIAVDDEAGKVTLQVNSAPGAIDGTVSVMRVHQDGKIVPLRGYGFEYDRAPFTQIPIVVEDYEAPLGESVWYKVDWYNTSDARTLRLYTQTTPTPKLSDPDYVWLKSPGIPATNTRVMMEAPPAWSRAARSTRYDIVGRKNPIHRTGVRGGRTATLTILVWEEHSNALFDSLLDSGLPVLIQAMPGYGIEGNLYLSVADADVVQLNPDAREEGWRWTLEVAEIDRPEGGLQGSAGITWTTVKDTYATWEDIFSARVTWAEVLTKG